MINMVHVISNVRIYIMLLEKLFFSVLAIAKQHEVMTEKLNLFASSGFVVDYLFCKRCLFNYVRSLV